MAILLWLILTTNAKVIYVLKFYVFSFFLNNVYLLFSSATLARVLELLRLFCTGARLAYIATQ